MTTLSGRLLLLAALCVLPGVPANLLLATDYYVSGAGDDANDGLSPATAFRTLTQAFTVAVAGDRVVVADGSYDTGAGETFPLAVPDGASVEGPADGSAVVDSTGTAGPAFTVGALANPTVLSGLTVQADTANGTCVLATGVPTDFTLQDNVLSGEHGFFNFPLGAIPPGGAAGVLASGNTVSADGWGLAWAVANGTGTHAVTLTGNTIVTAQNGLTVYGLASGGGNATIQATVTDNQVSSASARGLRMLAVGEGAGSTTRLDVEMLRNQVTMAGVGGAFELHGTSSGSATLAGLVECNDFVSCSTAGVDLSLDAGGGGAASSAVLFRYNLVRNNATGFRSAVTVNGSAQATFQPELMGNAVLTNAGDGVVLSSAATANATLIYGPEFGGTVPGTFGLNTFGGNNVTSGAFYDFNLVGKSDDTRTITAGGNWWGASNTVGIQMRINDAGTTPGLPTLGFQPFLFNALEFSPNVTLAIKGQPVLLTGGPGTFFLEQVGSSQLQLFLAGYPVPGYVVDGASNEIVVTVPTGIPRGGQELIVINASGQAGAIILPVVSENNDDCFLATAAYGDRDAPEVRLLRRWRDESLAGNALGRGLVRAYYACSPGLAEATAGRPWARALARAGLMPVVGAARLWLERRWVAAAALLAVGTLLARLRRRRRAALRPAVPPSAASTRR